MIMTANLLKKVEIGNPLGYLSMWKELEEYNNCQSDEEIATFYHKMLDKADKENRQMLRDLIFSMISFSTRVSFNPQMLVE